MEMKIYKNVLKSKTLTLAEKLIISIIISYQDENLVCDLSNEELVKFLSVSEKTLERLITKLNKISWFESKRVGNSKEMRVNKDEFFKYLKENKYGIK